jgi:hypothetical protein
MILTLKGQVVYPEWFRYPNVECQLSGDARLSNGKEPATSIGSLTANGARLMAYIPIRQERMSASIAGADRFLTLELTSTPLHYRRALIMFSQFRL